MTTITDAAGRAGHTPGPWATETCHASGTIYVVAGAWPLGSTVCEIIKDVRDGDPLANAHLIAAATDYDAAARDLLVQFAALDDEFLREAAAEKDGTGIFTGSAPPLTPALARSVLAFRAALALAEGR